MAQHLRSHHDFRPPKRGLRVFVSALALLSPLWAQQTNFPYPYPIGIIGKYTVANLPTTGLPNPSLAYATDSNAGSCTVGSSTTLQLCQWNGSAWSAVGGSSGGTPGGTSGQVQYNDGAGGFGADSGFAYNSTTHNLGIFGTLTSGQTGTHQGALALNGATSGTFTLSADATGGTATASGAMTIPSPTLTGTPTAPTATSTDSSTKLATTAFVQTVRLGFMATAWCITTVGTGNGTTYFLMPGSGAANQNCTSTGHTQDMPLPVACTAGNLSVAATAAGAQAGSGVTTVYKSGSPTMLTCTLGTGTTCNDTTHTVSYSAGDTWTVGVATGQATDSTAGIRASFTCK